MDILEAYNFPLEKYLSHLNTFMHIYTYETIIKDDVIVARETATEL
jgi:hypothetical protein